MTREQSHAVTTSMATSFGFAGVGEASVGLEISVAKSISVQVSSSLTTSSETVWSSECGGGNRSPSGNWFVWQWYVEQEADDNGFGFQSKTNNYICTQSLAKQHEPRCPLGFCADEQCHTCLEPFEDHSVTSATP